MTERLRDRPDTRSERERRLAAALRANLKRRKAQQRKRADPAPETRPLPSAGERNESSEGEPR